MTTSNLSDQARRLFNSLPEDGSKVGNTKTKDRLSISTLDYQKAKDELKAEGLIVLGKGRGGSIGRNEGAELPDQEKPLSKEERMAMAREAKEAKTKAQKEHDALRDHVESIGWAKHPDALNICGHPYDMGWYYEIWTDKGATTEKVEQEDLLL